MVESMIQFRKPTTLIEILNYTRNNLEDFYRARDSYCVYCKEFKLDINLIYYLDDSPEISDDDEEIYSDFVRENNLQLVVTSEVISQVIEVAIQEKEMVSNEVLVEAVKFYNKHDDFIKF